MVLFIDTADYNKTRFALIGSDGVITLDETAIPYQESFSTLGHVEKLIADNNASGKIERIVVASGPGAFTGLRVGLAMAQGLSLVWKVPVLTIESEKLPKDLRELITIHGGQEELIYG